MKTLSEEELAKFNEDQLRHFISELKEFFDHRVTRLQKEVEDYQKIASIHFSSKHIIKSVADQLYRCVKEIWNQLDDETKKAAIEYEKIEDRKFERP